MVKRINRQYLFGPLLYVLAFAFAWLSPGLSLGIEALLAAFYLLPGIELKSPEAKPKSTQEVA
jgi:TMEM175 potassium channel family protein